MSISLTVSSDEDPLKKIRCPACVSGSTRRTDVPDPGRLDLVREVWLVCHDCGRKYPIRDSVPVMLIEEGDKNRNTPMEELGEPGPLVSK